MSVLKLNPNDNVVLATSELKKGETVVVDGKEGMAVVAMTSYHDGSQEPTFIINLGDYTINLFAE